MNARELRVYSTSGIYTPKMVNDCVARGIKFIEQYCSDWFENTDLDKLAMKDPELCMLGQNGRCILERIGRSYGRIKSGYAQVVEIFSSSRLASDCAWTAYHGFNIRYSNDGDSENATRWEMLQLAWVTAIKERLALAETQS